MSSSQSEKNADPAPPAAFARVTRRIRGLPAWWSTKVFPGEVDVAPLRPRWGLLLLALLAGFLFFFQLHQPLLDPDEGRQAEIPREMLDRGDWLVPYWRGKPYYEKPPLQYWLTASLYMLFGVAPTTARLVPVLAAWLTVLVTYRWGRRALGASPALMGAAVLCLTPGFFLLGRTVTLDSLLTLAVVGAWYSAYRAIEGPRLDRRWWLLATLICGLGILQKGPVILILVLVPIIAFARLQFGAARLRWTWLTAFVLLTVSVALPWYLAMALNQPGYLETFLWRANVVRFVKPFDHQQPWWFYVPVLLVGGFPWSLLAPALAVFLFSGHGQLAARRPAGLGLLVLASAWCVLFYSLSGCKSPPYLMPALPPLALIIGAFLHAILSRELPAGFGLLKLCRKMLPLTVALTMLLLAPVALSLPRLFRPSNPWWFWPVGLAGTLLLLLAWLRIRHATPTAAWLFLALVTLVGIHGPLKETVWAFAARRSPANIAAATRSLIDAPHTHTVLFDRDWPSMHFYLERQQFAYFDWNTTDLLQKFLKHHLEKQPDAQIVILVDNGAKLESLRKTLPRSLHATIRRPPQPDQPALLILRWPPHDSPR